MSADVFELQVFTLFKVLQKFWEKYIKKQRDGSFQMPEGGPGGPTRRPGGLVARPHPRSCQGGAWAPCHSYGFPLWPIFTPRPETLEDETIFTISSSVSLPPRFQDRDSLTILSRQPTGGRIDL